jgi:putative SOS response-associated peptidase YedK
MYMCGRFTLTAPREVLRELFPLFDIPEVTPSYNVAPTQTVLAVRVPAGRDRPEPVLLKWGLVPGWADDPAIGNRLINARAETVAEKPAFRSAFRQRRCLVLADGFYEWQKVGGKKQPYLFRLQGGAPFAFAGLWEHWERDGRAIDSCTVLTTSANELVKPLHERMPVILAPADFDRWLDPKPATGPELQGLLRPYPAEAMTAYPVATRVNNARHNDADCVAPLAV